MIQRTRIFVDFWNFQLSWNSESIRPDGDRAMCDWARLPRVLAEAAQTELAVTDPNASLSIDETLVHASWNPHAESDRKLKGWLDSFLDKQPSFRVKCRERRPQAARLRCSACSNEIGSCPECQTPYLRYPEKGVDSAILVDLLTLAWENAYDVAILVSSDADLVPGVEKVQERGLKVINATWRERGHHLAKASWASFSLNALVEDLVRLP